MRASSQPSNAGAAKRPQSSGSLGSRTDVASALPTALRWLAAAHPDGEAKNLREIWLPALEWYYSERVRQLTYTYRESRATDANGTPLSDEAVMEAADFGVFIE